MKTIGQNLCAFHETIRAVVAHKTGNRHEALVGELHTVGAGVAGRERHESARRREDVRQRLYNSRRYRPGGAAPNTESGKHHPKILQTVADALIEVEIVFQRRVADICSNVGVGLNVRLLQGFIEKTPLRPPSP
ncbi:MAG: hypothetical protein IPM98_19335 [Lewinellaceae bacterium]|nr:hypothetical protein [Lewinellaceae bacterium]